MVTSCFQGTIVYVVVAKAISWLCGFDEAYLG